jgi:hypothetical protein
LGPRRNESLSATEIRVGCRAPPGAFPRRPGCREEHKKTQNAECAAIRVHSRALTVQPLNPEDSNRECTRMDANRVRANNRFISAQASRLTRTVPRGRLTSLRMRNTQQLSGFPSIHISTKGERYSVHGSVLFRLGPEGWLPAGFAAGRNPHPAEAAEFRKESGGATTGDSEGLARLRFDPPWKECAD